MLGGFLAFWGVTNWPRTQKVTRTVVLRNRGTAFPTSPRLNPKSAQTTLITFSRDSSNQSTEPPRNIKRLHSEPMSKPLLSASGVALWRANHFSPQPVPSPTPLPSPTPHIEATPAKTPMPVSSPSPNLPMNDPEVRRPNLIRRIVNGFINFFRRQKIKNIPPVNEAPQILEVTASSGSILRDCQPRTRSDSCTPTDSEETLVAKAIDPDGDRLLYTWSITGGRLSGEGRQVTWDLSGVANGSYRATVEVNDGNQHTASGSTTVTVADCGDCVPPPPPCPVVSVSCLADVEPNAPITFTASVSGGAPGASWTYNWSVSAGTISSGQGTSTITVDTAGLGGQSVTATVSIGGTDPSCTGRKRSSICN